MISPLPLRLAYDLDLVIWLRLSEFKCESERSDPIAALERHEMSAMRNPWEVAKQVSKKKGEQLVISVKFLIDA